MDIQSNALRGEYMRDIVDTTIKEINNDIATVFGPGAVDAFITKDGNPYYTRDGMEVLKSLKFDNELSQYILKIIFQAAYRQGKVVGDGTTTLIMLYTNLYLEILSSLELKSCYGSVCESINILRKTWNDATKLICDQLKKESHPINENELLSLLYTCTQDTELSAKIYTELKDAILDNSYIIINKSNIESDFRTTTYNLPLIKATRQFTVRPINEIEDDTVILHCNGMLDIVHPEVLFGLMNIQLMRGDTSFNPNIVILCNGITDVTRKTAKELLQTIRTNNLDVSSYTNIAIYTIDNYRGMSSDMIEDMSTIITDEPGIGGLVNNLTFESMLYQTFKSVINTDIPELDTFDCDLHFLDKLRTIVTNPFSAQFDDVEGIRITKPLGPVAQKRYDDLRKEIEEEKSEVRKVQLNKRLRSVYGQFIEVEIGSKLIKESQRKYELVMDAILSAGEGVRYGVLSGNSILITIRIISRIINDHTVDNKIIDILKIIISSLVETWCDMMRNVYHMGGYTRNQIVDWIGNADISKFDMMRGTAEDALPTLENSDKYPDRTITVPSPDGSSSIEINASIVESVTNMVNILENSTIPLELATAKTFHLNTFMQNYL